MTYRDAGVDVAKVRAAQKSIGEIISVTHKLLAAGKVVSGFGHYAGLIKLGTQLIALHSDGVGTKVLIAQMMNKFDTIGVDCVAMNVNDVICVGAQPIGFIDYIALRQPNEWLLEEIVRGLVEGAKQNWARHYATRNAAQLRFPGVGRRNLRRRPGRSCRA